MPTLASAKQAITRVRYRGETQNVAVIDQHMLIPRLAQHLHQIAHLARSAQPFAALHQSNRTLGKLRPQPLDLAYSRIVETAHAEDDLKACRHIPACNGSPAPHTCADRHLSPASGSSHQAQTASSLSAMPVVSKASRSP